MKACDLPYDWVIVGSLENAWSMTESFNGFSEPQSSQDVSCGSWLLNSVSDVEALIESAKGPHDKGLTRAEISTMGVKLL